MLPFEYDGSAQPQGTYMARYLLHHQRLVAIRLCTKTSYSQDDVYRINGVLKWPRGEVCSIKTPSALEDYYQANQLDPYPTYIPTGDIIFHLKNLALGMIFMSEVNDKDESLKKTMQECLDLKCQIISIVQDVPRDSTFGTGQLKTGNRV